MKRRVLLLGTTGVNKRQAAERLIDSFPRQQKWELVEFESDYLFNEDKAGIPRLEFLDMDARNQVTQWNKAWEALAKEKLNADDSTCYILSIHGCYMRAHYGVRSVLNIERIVSDFRPDIIFTLITDVYDMWWRTEDRAAGDALHGRPTLEMLLLSRRNELMLGDMIVNACTGKSVRNYMVSTLHPISTLNHLIQSTSPRTIYLSFPISEPRRMLGGDTPDRSGMDEVSIFIKSAYEFQETHRDISFFCPLTIDELPLRQIIVDQDKRQYYKASPDGNWRQFDDDGHQIEYLSFSRDEHRWPIENLYDVEKCLARPTGSRQIPFPASYIEEVCGNIYTDVTFRDYRYVEQSDCVAVYSPVFRATRAKMSRSVQGEIDYATKLNKRVYAYQDAHRDPQGVIDDLFGAPGTMAADPSRMRRYRVGSVPDLFQAVLTYKSK